MSAPSFRQMNDFDVASIKSINLTIPSLPGSVRNADHRIRLIIY